MKVDPAAPCTPRRRRGFLLPLIASATLALTLMSAAAALAFKIERNSNSNLDGKIVLSPAAERITTTERAGGEQIGPGSTVVRQLLLQNRSRQTTEFDLDVAQVVGSNAEDIVEIRHGVRQGAAAWATLERQTVTLRPGDIATINVTIQIPEAVKPGSKPFAVTATQRAATAQTEGAGVTPIFRQVAIFIVELPGEAPIKGKIVRAELVAASDTLRRVGDRGRLLPFYPGHQTMRAIVEYRNDGERLLTPEGRIEVRNVFDKVVQRYDVRRFTVYPDGANAFEVRMARLPSFGLLRAELVLESDAGTQRRQLGSFVLAPWWMLAVVAALLGLAVYQLVRWWIERRALIAELAAEELAAEGLDDPDDRHGGDRTEGYGRSYRTDE